MDYWVSYVSSKTTPRSVMSQLETERIWRKTEQTQSQRRNKWLKNYKPSQEINSEYPSILTHSKKKKKTKNRSIPQRNSNVGSEMKVIPENLGCCSWWRSGTVAVKKMANMPSGTSANTPFATQPARLCCKLSWRLCCGWMNIRGIFVTHPSTSPFTQSLVSSKAFISLFQSFCDSISASTWFSLIFP